MIPQHVSMVGGKTNDGIIEVALFSQGSNDDSKLMINLRAECVKG